MKNIFVKQKNLNINGWIVLILLIILFSLCMPVYAFYKSYNGIKTEYKDALVKVNAEIEIKNDLLNQNQILTNEINILKADYKNLVETNKAILLQLDTKQKQNDELTRINREISEDNAALENSLKEAASVGIKPKNYITYNNLPSRGDVQRGKYLGRFLGTAYTPNADECGNNSGITNSGNPIVPGITVAIDNKYWPFGTVFYIKGLGYAVAMDTGGSIRGRNRFDFAVFDKKFAKRLGSQYWEVSLVRLGTGKVEI